MLPVLSCAAAKADASIGASAAIGLAGYEGELDAYGSMEPVEVPAAPYLSAGVRVAVSYKPTKRYGFGAALERTVGFSPGHGLIGGMAIGFFASVAP